jgi:NDP-mannose synthase
VGKKAVILAGGKGSRLSPYTTVLPKPLLPIGDRAILDVVLRQLHGHGFNDVTLAVGYLAHLIQAVCGDGSRHDISIQYHEEHHPLGTAGALASIEGLDETFLAMNGDVLTAIDYARLYALHREAGNMLTIATHRRVVRTDYGVIHENGMVGGTRRVTGYEEKPEIPYTVSMGIYVFDPAVLKYIELDTYLDLPDLVLRLLGENEQVAHWLYDGYWLDIGRHDDYEKAIAEYEQLKDTLWPEEDPQPQVEPAERHS